MPCICGLMNPAARNTQSGAVLSNAELADIWSSRPVSIGPIAWCTFLAATVPAFRQTFHNAPDATLATVGLSRDARTVLALKTCITGRDTTLVMPLIETELANTKITDPGAAGIANIW